MPQFASSIPQTVTELCRSLKNHGYDAWLVGGSLRDLAMSRTPGDWDLATSATPEQVIKVFPRVIPTGIKHGTVTVISKGNQYEVTTLRGEGDYSDGRRPDNVFFVKDIEQDLARRDFTINAMALDPLDGRLIDPYGGLADIESRTIQCVGKPEQRLREDGLRSLRAARFCATLEFEVHPHTQKAITQALDVFCKVSHERVRDECNKALLAKKPSRAFKLMQHTGLLQHISQELVKQVDCQQNKYHRFDVWDHTLACVDASIPTIELRLAALLHDIGKPKSRGINPQTQEFTFYNHEKIGTSMAEEWLKNYRYPNQQRQRIVHLIRHHLVCYTSEWKDAAVRRFVQRVGKDAVSDLFELARADAIAKGFDPSESLAALDELKTRIDKQQETGSLISAKDLKVDGSVLMQELQLRPGRHIGETLRYLLEVVVDDPSQNSKQKLLAIAQNFLKEQS